MLTDENKLIERILNGHPEDYGYFIERYGDELMRLVSRLVPKHEDAEELVQDAFVSAFSALNGFLGQASFSTWLCRIAYRCALSHIRRRKVTTVPIDDKMVVAEADIDKTLADLQRAEQLRRAIGMLTPDEQTIVTLFYYDDRPMREIAYITGIEPGNVATRLHRIRKKLYVIISNMDKGIYD